MRCIRGQISSVPRIFYFKLDSNNYEKNLFVGVVSYDDNGFCHGSS